MGKCTRRLPYEKNRYSAAFKDQFSYAKQNRVKWGVGWNLMYSKRLKHQDEHSAIYVV